MSVMNKYTLKFRYNHIEQEYNNYRCKTMKIPVFTTGSVCILIISTYKMIQLVLNGQSNLIPILIVCQFFSLISLVLMRFRIHQVDVQLLILAFLLVAYEFIIQADINAQALALYWTNFTYCSVIIIMVSDYICSIIQILGILLFRLIYTIYIETQKSYSLYTTATICICFLCFFSYKINILSRINFLLSQQDYMWERVFPKILDKPYIIFQLNEEKLEFFYKQSANLNFVCNNSDELKIFLRGWKQKQESLENIIFQSIKHSKQLDIQTNLLEIHNQKKEKLNIKITIFKAISCSIILSFEEKMINNQNHAKQIQKIIENTQVYKNNLLKFVYNNIKNSLLNGKKKQIRALLYICYIQKLMNKIKLGKSKFGLIKQSHFNEIIQLFKHKKLSIQFKIPEINLQLFNITYFKRLAFEILKLAKKKSTVLIKLGQQSFIVYEGGSIMLQKNKQLQKIFNSQIQNIEIIGSLIKINLFNEPHQSFVQKDE